jgi:hypothetical protein
MAWKVEASDLIRAVEQCHASIGKGARYRDCGIFPQCSDEGITFLATDRVKLTRYHVRSTRPGFSPDKSRMIPQEAIKSLLAVAKSDPGSTLYLEFQDDTANPYGNLRHWYMRVKNTMVDLRITLDDHASLPNFSEVEVFPAERAATLTITSPDTFLRAVKVASHGAESVVMRSNGAQLTVCSTADECIEVPADVQGEAFSRTLNAKALLAYLKTQAKSDRLPIGISPQSDDRVTSTGKTFETFGPIIFGYASEGSQYVIQPLEVETTEPATVEVVEPPSEFPESITSEPISPPPGFSEPDDVEVTVKVAAMNAAPAVKVKRPAKVKADPIGETITSAIERARAEWNGRNYDCLGVTQEVFANLSNQEQSAIGRRLTSYGWAKSHPGETTFYRFERFVRECVNGSSVSFPEPTPQPPSGRRPGRNHLRGFSRRSGRVGSPRERRTHANDQPIHLHGMPPRDRPA